MSAPAKDISALLLCGGKSERLGFPKEMLRADGAPLAVHLVRRLGALCAEVAVSSNHPEYLEPWSDVPILKDSTDHDGPLAGLLAGLQYCRTDRLFILACDMPLAHNELIESLMARARSSEAEAVVARAEGRVQPLCGVYRRSLVAKLERFLASGTRRQVHAFLDNVRVECVDVEGEQAASLRDIDTASDLALLQEMYSAVEPLPVRRVPIRRIGKGDPVTEDLIAEEWSVTVRANAVRLATVMCLPSALEELGTGLAVSLGLAERMEQVRRVEADYARRRVLLDLDVEDERLGGAVQRLVTSACGANVYGMEAEVSGHVAESPRFRVRASHVLDCLKRLRRMAPVFERTGGTHQAAFTDGERIRFFFEDVGRHNAVDKVVGAALRRGASLSGGALITTGRLNTEMIAKAIRARVPVVASRGAPSSEAVRLAGERGITLIGFARGNRMNVYTSEDRARDA